MEWHVDLLELFEQHAHWAILLSIGINVLVAVAGLLPSVFITAANVYYFGFAEGTIISAAGEALGAAVSFLLYRFWFRHRLQNRLGGFPKVQPLLQAAGAKAAGWVFVLRLMPLVPSGIVTLAAATSNISFVWFIGASSLGKVPALLLEAAMVKGFLNSAWPVQVALLALAIVLAIVMIKK